MVFEMVVVFFLTCASRQYLCDFVPLSDFVSIHIVCILMAKHKELQVLKPNRLATLQVGAQDFFLGV
jgi:hypothetical protein